jgi:predicted Zn-dependent protease
VLAHEAAHVTARHPLVHTIEVLATAIFAQMFGTSASDLGGSAAGLGGALVISSYSRKKEAEADRIAARILRDARLTSQGLVKFFERLKKKSGTGNTGALALFSTHPELGKRAASLKGNDNYPTTPVLNAAEWKALKKICG